MYFIVTFVNYVVTNRHKQTCEGNSSPRKRKISVLKLFAQETRHRNEISGCLTVNLKYSRNILEISSTFFPAVFYMVQDMSVVPSVFSS